MKFKLYFHRLSILINALYGYIIKFKIDIFGIGKINSLDDSVDLIISLTSYGRRVESVVYYTIVSLLKQKRMPKKIILWLSEDEWSINTIPNKLKLLKSFGVDIFFCKDIKSYKKLIPTMNLFPNSMVITVDDDIYYSKYLVFDLYESALKEPNKIHCLRCAVPTFNIDGSLKNYNMWEEPANIVSDGYIFPIGCGGILYPPYSLYKDACNDDLFTKLAPNADDIWFWCMALLNNTTHRYVKKSGCNYSFDAIYQYFHNGSALTHSNSKQSKNDIQITNVIKYYNINL